MRVNVTSKTGAAFETICNRVRWNSHAYLILLTVTTNTDSMQKLCLVGSTVKDEMLVPWQAIVQVCSVLP